MYTLHKHIHMQIIAINEKKRSLEFEREKGEGYMKVWKGKREVM